MEESSRNGLSNACINTINGNASSGWESASNGAVDSFIKIGFHTVFTINKLRIRPNLVLGRQIKEILMEFSDCSYEKVRWQVKTVTFKPRKRRRQKQGRHAPITRSIQFIQHTRSSITRVVLTDICFLSCLVSISDKLATHCARVGVYSRELSPLQKCICLWSFRIAVTKMLQDYEAKVHT